MKRIVLTPVIESYAADYLADLRKLTNKPEDRLKRLRNQLSGDYYAYVDTIIQNYGDIITAEPEYLKGKIVSLFSVYSSTVDKSSFHTINYTKQNGTIDIVNKKFYILLTDALGYDDVQEKVFPKYIKKMGIKSCVYCNAQYAVAAKKGKREKKLDFSSPSCIIHFACAYRDCVKVARRTLTPSVRVRILLPVPARPDPSWIRSFFCLPEYRKRRQTP